MRGIAFLLFGLTLVLLAGIVSANDEVEDNINSISKIKDTIEILDIVNENNKELDRLREDPANEELLGENVEKALKRGLRPLIGDVDNPESVKSTMIGWIFITFILVILGIVLPMSRR